ncbi:hypothetical protein KY495_00755 [Massilia sp. PAMC28688]|uniref:hypothetical protein n=1 Tax=Massilia sp. PAMC28688 TaxID=2861283 RepID=UPI001C629044|nr:hypothetical protein [Massilia sp. PAMC28688]QYF93804.1 hypothetical protein KY495_00755 [Massilia sp. PAMC28688]
MNACRSLAALALLATSLLLGGCASTSVSLVEVREFASASTKLGGYAELSKRYRDTYQREKPYLTPLTERMAKENDVKRRAAYDDFASAQKALVLYMQTLSVLASDTRYDLTPQLDDMGSGIKALAGSGMEQKHAVAYTGLTRLLTRVIASGYQGRSVETMVRDGEPHVRVLLDGMMALTRLYSKTHENEKKTVLGIFDVEIPFASKPQDRMLVTMAKVHYQDKVNEYKALDKRYDLAMQGLTKVALGHQKLRERLDKLHTDEVRHMLADYARDLRLIYLGLHQ